MTKKMTQALNDMPIESAILNHSVDEGDSMGWFGNSGSEYKANTLIALVKRGLIQLIKYGERPYFVVKTDDHSALYYKEWNEYWINT